MTHFKGDRIQYTGKSEVIYGKLAYEFRYIEGHKRGKSGWTYNPPESTVAENTRTAL